MKDVLRARLPGREVSALAIAAAVAAAGLCLGDANAGTVLIEGLDEAIKARSRSVAGVYDAPPPRFTHSALFRAHEHLHQHGIRTDRHVTILLADTDRGLSLMVLIDDETVRQGSKRFDSQVRFFADGPSSADILNNGPSDLSNITFQRDPERGTQSARGTYTWKSERRGDAFAWAGLVVGDSGTFTFDRNGDLFRTHPGLSRKRTFQFLTWNGTDWERLALGRFDANRQFFFQWTIIPLPRAVWYGLFGLACAGAFGWWRKRRAMGIEDSGAESTNVGEDVDRACEARES